MTGILAQIVALVAYGNDFLKTGNLQDDFSIQNSTFQFCDKVDFRIFINDSSRKQTKEDIIAENPYLWYRRLYHEGCNKLRLYFEYSKNQPQVKDYRQAGFVGGGGIWLIEAVYDRNSDYWSNRWEANSKNPNGKIWCVKYARTAMSQRSANLFIDSTKIKEKLGQTLNNMVEFCQENNLENWHGFFDKAQSILEFNNPEQSYYHKDLIPICNYSLVARQILFSAGNAWAFGGMGSWNDISFGDQSINEHYEKLSEQLYSNIIEAIIASINSF